MMHLSSPDALVGELSGGQRQGVAIARAMHFKSRLLVLDEPTNHLSVKETDKAGTVLLTARWGAWGGAGQTLVGAGYRVLVLDGPEAAAAGEALAAALRNASHIGQDLNDLKGSEAAPPLSRKPIQCMSSSTMRR